MTDGEIAPAVLVLAQMRATGPAIRRGGRACDMIDWRQESEALDGIRSAAGGRHHDDGNRDIGLAQVVADLSTVGIRQTDIQQDRVQLLGLGDVQRLGAGPGFQTLEFAVLELLNQGLAQVSSSSTSRMRLAAFVGMRFSSPRPQISPAPEHRKPRGDYYPSSRRNAGRPILTFPAAGSICRNQPQSSDMTAVRK